MSSPVEEECSILIFETASHCSPGWTETQHVAQIGLEFSRSSSASELRLLTWTPAPRSSTVFDLYLVPQCFSVIENSCCFYCFQGLVCFEVSDLLQRSCFTSGNQSFVDLWHVPDVNLPSALGIWNPLKNTFFSCSFSFWFCLRLSLLEPGPPWTPGPLCCRSYRCALPYLTEKHFLKVRSLF